MTTLVPSSALVFQDYGREPALARCGRTFVPGEWPVLPTAVLVGEAPGETEEAMRRPFVGRAGRRLERLLAYAGLPRTALGLTNIVKLRPTDANGRNRPPSEGEVSASMPYLWRELDLHAGGHTRVVCALGRTAIKALSKRDEPVGKVRGQWMGICDPVGLRWVMFATYHPSAALRDPRLHDVLAEDLKKFAAEVGRWGQEAAEVLRP